MSDDAEVIIVGGGHAGLEAALASARLGARTLLVTGDPERICTLPCNPSIGGSAKGQIVREIDALGGAMADLIDRSSLHVRMLNESKGPAVRALRAQADKPRYAQLAREALTAESAIRVATGLVDDLIVENAMVRGVACTDGMRYFAPTVVLATGTFLGGKIYRGEFSEAAGRFGEAPAIGLSHALARLGFPLGRLKTGTPPRIDRTSVDFAKMGVQSPSNVPFMFSYDSVPAFAGPQLPCYIVHTNDATHALVRDNLGRSPLYGLDLIRGIGPRYCPSIEDKVIKFAHNPSHQIFVEPEGWNEPTLYVGGFSTSLPADVQILMLRTLPGFEDVVMLRAGYAVEYDYVPPTELHATLETRRIAGLFHCGQLNGTSGYEEAAAQGLVAGINAARRALRKPGIVFRRENSYIGTMLDDLTSRGVDEPYRMMTSRAEHRIILRHDNADLRLTPLGHEIGLVRDDKFSRFIERRDAVERGIEAAKKIRVGAGVINGTALDAGATVADALRRPEVEYTDIADRLPDFALATVERVAIELKCEGYVRRAQLTMEQAQRSEGVEIPVDFDFSDLRGVSIEGRERLSQARPQTIGAASRLRGVTPADIAVLSVFVRRAQVSAAL